ncbi:CHC2 zinc finger domain-containing protein [Desulforudis sp. 1190]|uniref:CHC2 zinc finger domain-containing protein n=1 Tax=Desulforudis sp. 1190 TaxID=3416136 RepID=UPI003CF130CF
MAGLSPVRRGRQWFVRCPFHAGGNERTPSLSVSPDGNLWFCFACGEGGDAISFIAKLRGVRPVEAARNFSIGRLKTSQIRKTFPPFPKYGLLPTAKASRRRLCI